jgi:DnaK suppressor protein
VPRASKSSTAPAAAPKAAPRKVAKPAPAEAQPVASKATARPAAAPKAAKPKAPAGAGKAGAPKPAGDKFLAEQRALLLVERATYEEQAASLKAQADQMAQEMEPGDIQFDDESGEGASANVDRERDLALSAQARAAVDEIDRAMAKIDAGSYGICEGCGQPIPRARLKALPYARLCVACKSGGLSRR